MGKYNLSIILTINNLFPILPTVLYQQKILDIALKVGNMDS